MVRAYLVVLTLSVIAAVLAMVPVVVIYFSIVTLGLGIAMLVPAANLWWVMILLGPVVLLGRIGRPVWGVAITVALAAAVTGGFYVLRDAALREIAAPETLSMPGALAGRVAGSVEIRDDRDRAQRDVPCDALCEGLLTAGADWVRVAVWGAKDEPGHILFRRAGAEECRALDPGFPGGAPCILLGADDGRAADLLVQVEVSGNHDVAREDRRGFAFVYTSERFTVTDQRAGTVLHDQLTRYWMQAVAPVPLLPNSSFDVNGMHGGGLTFVWERLADPMPEVAEVLTKLGQPVEATRVWVETQAA